MSFESRQRFIEDIGRGDMRSSGSRVGGGQEVRIADADFTSNEFDMLPHMQMIFVTIASAGTNYINLPSVKEAAGKLYSFWASSVATGTVAIRDLSDDTGLVSISLTTGTQKLLYSDGLHWMLITQTITS